MVYNRQETNMKKIFLLILLFSAIGILEVKAQAVNCPKCNGKGYTALNCQTCHGRGGNERYTYRDCRACKGARTLKKISGYIDGKAVYKNVKCEYCNGTGREKASSEWIRCSTCNGSGEQRQKCYRCDGKGVVRVYRN